MLTPRFPYPPTRGDTLRSWNQLEYLARRHDVWLGCVDERRPYPAQLARVREICRDVALVSRSPLRALLRGGISLARGRSLTRGYFGCPELTERIRTWATNVEFDAVLTFSSAMAPYAEFVDARRVLDMVDVDSHKWRIYARRARPPLRWLYALEARRLRAAEARWRDSHDVTLVVNERERRKLPPGSGDGPSDVLRTTVELAEPKWHRLSPAGGPSSADLAIGCIGSMFYPPNVRAVEWFGKHVWPRVRSAVPEVKWWIVGNRPTRKVRRWARDPRVTVTGFVPDTRPYLDAMRVFVNPVDGDIGVQSKLLGAMAAGKPAVVTPDTAAGIDYRGEPPFLIARAPDEFADAVVRALTDPVLSAELGRRARDTIRAGYQTADQVRRVERWLAGEAPGTTKKPQTTCPEKTPAPTGTSPAAPTPSQVTL